MGCWGKAPTISLCMVVGRYCRPISIYKDQQALARLVVRTSFLSVVTSAVGGRVYPVHLGDVPRPRHDTT